MGGCESVRMAWQSLDQQVFEAMTPAYLLYDP